MISSNEFAALSHEEQIARIEQLGRNALREFGVEPDSITPLVHAENTTYRVDSNRGTFCLRVCRPGYQSDANVLSEIEFMAALRHSGLGAPEPYGERVVKAVAPEVPEARNCVLLGWQSGEFRREGYAPEDALKLGRLMAKMHEFSTGWNPPAGFDRQQLHDWAFRPRQPMPFDEPTPMASDENRALLLEVDRETRKLLAEIPRDSANFGLIHADMHYGNVLFDFDRINLIDFDDTGWGFWLYDMAAALAYAVSEPRYEEVRDALLAGYEEVRPLPPQTRERLAPFIRLRLAGIAKWMMDRSDNPRLRERGPWWIEQMCAGIRTV
jgi:Ser/Thr protein kinase RdoA (MazF antagonist)